MFKKFLAFIAAMSVVAAFAAVDVNKASEAELDGVKGIGPVTTKLIVSERKKGDFKSWEDFISRVKGVGDNSAAKFSASGLTVSGASYTGPGAAKAKVEAKADVKADAKPVSEKAKDAAVATKDAVKGAAIKTGAAVKETAKDAKAAVTPNKEVKTEVKVEAPKTAASASANVSTKK